MSTARTTAVVRAELAAARAALVSGGSNVESMRVGKLYVRRTNAAAQAAQDLATALEAELEMLIRRDLGMPLTRRREEM